MSILDDIRVLQSYIELSKVFSPSESLETNTPIYNALQRVANYAHEKAKKELKKTILQYEENELILSVSEQNNATIETLFVNNDIDLKNLKENKTLIAYDFYQKEHTKHYLLHR